MIQTDLDYAIQRMRDALDDLERSVEDSSSTEILQEIAGGLGDACDALSIPNDLTIN